MNMKALKFLVIGTLLLFAGSVQAQISVRLNLGTPPQWGPSGYSDVRYYYLPDVEAYYDVQSSMFIYSNGVSWVKRSSLPTRYRNYDLYGGYKVPMSDYRGTRPYSDFRKHKVQYAKGYRGQAQRNIGERPERVNSNVGNDSRSRSNQKVSRENNERDRRSNDRNKQKENDRERGNERNR
jgi:hypothetical protein